MEPITPVSGGVASQHFESLVDLIRHQSTAHAEHPALIFLPDGETESGRLTYQDLDRSARAFAAGLQSRELSGQAVLLMLPSSIDYVVAFVGSLYAGAIPVPVYPPTSSAHAERLAHIARDCDARGAIFASTAQLDGMRERLGGLFSEGEKCRFLSVDELSSAPEGDWMAPAPTPDALAYLQYTSGSTSNPRGVMVTHGNLLDHSRHLQEGWQQSQEDVYVTWLPLFHDLGLICGILQPFYLGGTSILMPSMAFQQRPMRWLRTISRYRATATAAPNFAYELCADAVNDEPEKSLDLSSWTVALNGAEPVRASTIRKFCNRFAPYGFRRETMNPAYGLAEATLTVSYGARQSGPVMCEVDADALERKLFIPSTGQQKTRELVACGQRWLDVRIAIVDPDTGHPCGENGVGEIWVHGPTVTNGYWKRPEQSRGIFQAHLPDGDGPFLRTGDLGVLHEGQLYVTGRLKDVIIIRGRNHYPQDIEQTVFRSHAALEPDRGAAFSIEEGGQERLVIVQEVRRTWRKKFDGKEVVQAILAAVAESHGLAPHAILLLNPASVHITSSGKIQRQACKQDYLAHRFEHLHAWTDGAMDAGQASSSVPARECAGDGEAPAYETILAAIRQWISRKKGMPAESIGEDQPFKSLGLNPVELLQMPAELSGLLGARVKPMAFFDHPAPRLAALHACERGAGSSSASVQSVSRQPELAAAVTPEQIKSWVQSYLLDRACAILRIGPGRQAELEPGFHELRFNQMGLDSLTAIDLCSKTFNELAVDVPVHYFLGSATVPEVVELIATQLMLTCFVSAADDGTEDDSDVEVCTL